MKTPLTQSQLNLLDTHPQRVEMYAAIHRPRIMAWGTLSAIPDNYPGSSVSIKNVVLLYNLTDILAGMTLRVGSESNKDDYGSLRVRSNYSSGSVIETAEFGSGLVNWKTGACLTVVEEFKTWPIHHSYDTSLSRWKVDLQEYTSQLSLYGPRSILGPPAVATFDGTKAVVPYVGNLSYSFTPGASITSQAWYFPNGETVTSALGSSAAPVNITYINASPNGRYHALAVTDGNGSSHISKRLTFVFGSAVDQQPARVSFEAITGGLKAGGYRTRFTMLDNAPSGVINDGALVVIFEKASYGTAGSSVGGNYYGRDNVVMVGRVANESMRIDPFTQELSFALETVDSELRRSNAYDLFLEGSSAASDWDMASNLTLDHAALALTKYRSTIDFVTDVHPASGAAATNEIYYRSLPAGNLWDQLAYNYDAAFGIVAADMQGTIWCGLDAQVTGLSANLPNIMAITKPRRLNTTTIEHEHNETNAQYRLYAIMGGTASPLGAESPGQRQGYFGGKQEVTRNLLVNDQDLLCTWSGNVRARDNNPYKRVSTTLTGNIRLDSVPQSRITMSLSATENRRGVEWINQTMIPHETVVNYNSNMYSNTDIVMETSVNGMGGSAITFPTPTNNGGGGGPGGGPESGGGLVYVATTTKVGRTRNFLDSSPHWENITGSLSGTIVWFCLDPYDPKNRAVVTTEGSPTTSGIFTTTNLDDDHPTWTLKQSINAVRIGTGGTGGVTYQIGPARPTITQNGLYYFGFYGTYHVGGDFTSLYVLKTTDFFDTVTYGLYRVSVSGSLLVVVTPSNRNADVCYLSGGGFSGLGPSRSTDGGLTFTDMTGEPIPAYGDIEAAYAGGDGTSEIYGWMFDSSTNGTIYKSSNRLVSFSSAKTNLYSSANGSLRTFNKFINVATHNVNDIMVLIPAGTQCYIQRSKDSGANWSTINLTGSDWAGSQALGRWPYDPERVFLLNANSIRYSRSAGGDFGDSVSVKTGDWATTMGGAFSLGVNIVPCWLA